MIGPTLQRYDVLAELGRGGMGVVYKARDLKLDRIVALKFLSSASVADEDAKRRFIREAKAISTLDHVNICTVHDIGETEDGELYIAMAYYEGETLKAKLSSGPMAVEMAVDYATQIADGLCSAHEKGIIHRDVKPANVVVTARGEVKILDFGLAKMDDATLTKTGMTLGTAAYMSPEQVRGDIVAARTDVWSLGVLLYEMLTGRRPFEGTYEQAIMYAILHEDPRPLPTAGVQEALKRAISAALAKSADDRPDMRAFREIVSSASTTASGPVEGEQKDILVLPFRDISRDQDSAYLSDGFTEEVITDLSRLRSLRVISRSSSMRLKDSEMSMAGMTRALNVRYVLDGSVRKSGERLRVTAQLIDAAKDENLWADKFDGTVEEVFDIQEGVARAVVAALRVRHSPQDDRVLLQRPGYDAKTQEAYLRARYALWHFSDESLRAGLRHVEHAIEHFGEDERLLSLLGQIHAQFLQIGAGDIAAHRDAAQDLVRKLSATNSGSVHAYRLRAIVRFHTGDIRSAIPDAQRAYELNSNDPDTLIILSYAHCLTGEEERALTLVEHLISIDPLTPVNYSVRGFIEVMRGKPERALPFYRKAYDMEPAAPFVAMFYSWILVRNGRFADAENVLNRLDVAYGQTIVAQLGRANLAAARGDRDLALELISPDVEEAAQNTEMFSRFVAEVLAMANERERALDWLENTVRIGMINYPYLKEHDPMLDNLRGDVRFQTLLRHVEDEWRHAASS